ncbi:hypothetical protein ACPPVT_14205 [Angustibacter sp. McL0619]|uniref:hypothetical protein n=1 Tax=Angustibacter sp. McL0619 TaxID=3415676 RepID=UPI003CF25262
MSRLLQVGVADRSGDDFLASQRIVWASLPLSLGVAASEPAQLVAVDGRQRDWLTVATETASSGVLGILVVHPRPGPAAAAVHELAARARDNGLPVVVETVWAAHPAVAQLADSTRARLDDVALADSVAIVAKDDPRSPASVLLDQLALLRAVLGPIDEVTFSASGASGHTVNARRGASAVALSAVRTSVSPAGARLAIYTASGEAHLVVPEGGTAAPARASVVDDQGESVLPSWYESASRASWRRLVEAVTSQQALADLDFLADDLDRIASLT